MTFCVDTIHHDDALRAKQGLLRHASLAVTADAQHNANRIRDDARKAAEQILQQARDEARQIVVQAEQQTLERMRGFLKSFEAQYAAFADQSTPLVINLALKLFDKLILSLTDRERIDAVVKRLVMEAPAKLTDALLHLHPSDLEHVQEAEWPVKANFDLAPGTALLVASSGEWRMEFDLAVESLKASLQQRLIDSSSV